MANYEQISGEALEVVPVEGHRLQALGSRAKHLDDAVGLEILFGSEEGILTMESVEITSVKEAKCGGRFLSDEIINQNFV